MGQKPDFARVGRDGRADPKRQKRLGQKFSLHRSIGFCCVLLASCSSAPPPLPGKIASIAAVAKTQFDSAKAWTNLVTQCDFGPRNSGSTGHLKCRDWIVEQCKKYTDKVTLQPFEHVWSKTKKPVKMWNIIAKMDFGKPKTVLLLAHWDTRPTANEDALESNWERPILGANDGASGVAVLLELMRVFKDNPPPVNITFLFTDGEDLGPSLDEMFLGAVVFAKSIKSRDYLYGILLDMIGDKDLRIPIEPNSQYYAGDLVTRFYKHCAETGMGQTFPSFSGPIIQDDHLALNEVGLPTMDLIDFAYPYWHTVHDTVDKCSAESLGKVGRTVESFLMLEKGQ